MSVFKKIVYYVVLTTDYNAKLLRGIIQLRFKENSQSNFILIWRIIVLSIFRLQNIFIGIIDFFIFFTLKPAKNLKWGNFFCGTSTTFTLKKSIIGHEKIPV